MLDKYFEKVYVITTFDSERVDYCKKQMEKAGVKNYEFITSVDYKIIDNRFQTCVHQNVPAQKYMSLCANNISLIQSAIYNRYNNICICEDDVFFSDDYKKQIKLFLDNVPDDWDMLNMGYLSNIYTFPNINEYVLKQTNNYWGCHCVAYKNTIYNDIINLYKKHYGNIPIDWMSGKLCNEKNIYIASNHFIFQVSRDYMDYNLNRANSDTLFDSLLFERNIPSYYLPQN